MKKHKAESGITESVINPHMELIGNTKCIIDGLKSIEEYTKGKIKLNLGSFSVTVFGDELYINTFTREGAVIDGMIITMEFEGND